MTTIPDVVPGAREGRPMRRAAALLAVLFLGLGAAQARAESVALTFDDLPQLSLTDSTDYGRVTTRRLLAGLRRDHIPATGFVVGSKLEGPEREARVDLLKAWLKAGERLGNHTYDHESLNRIPLDAYIASVERNDEVLRPILAPRREKPVWFRHPYLETGRTVKIKRAFESWLHGRGYRVAPVTLENSDWMFALPYDEAVLRGDTAEARRIRRAYVAYTDHAVRWYRRAALQLLGRRPALVFLLHASRINADSIDDLARVLRRNRLQPVTLGRAMRDPAYGIPDDRPDEAGDEWLSRWSELLHKPLPWRSFPKPPADIEAADLRLDADP
jgi:peptidoglycan/xylan/chitin deacetylase (PgdA/CDA1 family)